MEAVAVSLGMVRQARGRWSPCPRCGSEHTRSDRRATVLLGPRGWFCVACNTGGPDGISLASYALTGQRRATAQVFDFLEEKRLREPQIKPRPPAPPVRIDPHQALRQAKPIGEVEDARLRAWLNYRKISPQAPAGWLPLYRSAWWPDSRTWPLVLPACTGRGRIESMHGVAISEAPHKTQWPRGAEARELLFAAPSTRAFLTSTSSRPRQDVLVVEGATDFLTASMELPEMYVIGITAGGAGALALAPKVKGQRWYVATDPDPAGARYAERVAEALFPTPVYPLKLG